MPVLHLTTFMEAPVERVFDLSRSIDLHKQSMRTYDEQVVGGRTSGLIEIGEEVTWQAKHFFKVRKLKVKITAMHRPHSFIDEQVDGAFKRMKHEHFFKPCHNGTIMIDQFIYELPYGILGTWLEAVYMNRYMTALLEERNKAIKKAAESNGWKNLLN